MLRLITICRLFDMDGMLLTDSLTVTMTTTLSILGFEIVANDGNGCSLLKGGNVHLVFFLEDELMIYMKGYHTGVIDERERKSHE